MRRCLLSLVVLLLLLLISGVILQGLRKMTIQIFEFFLLSSGVAILHRAARHCTCATAGVQ